MNFNTTCGAPFNCPIYTTFKLKPGIMEFLLQLFAELVKGNENIIDIIEETEIAELEENEATENIFTLMHFH